MQVWKTEHRSSVITTKSSTRTGIIVCIIAGCWAGLFGPAFNVCTNDQFGLLKPGVPPLTVYTGYFYFCLACKPPYVVCCQTGAGVHA